MDQLFHGTTAARYQYAPLGDESLAIRLLRVSPWLSADGLIQCEIFHDTMSATYECLSYRWGGASSSEAILVNGNRFTVQQNLYDFLLVKRQRLSADHESLCPLWIDALCIDQMNSVEKSRQVARMDQIFRNASRVNVWLGTDTTGSLRALNSDCQEQLPQIVEWANVLKAPIYGEEGKVSPLLAHMLDGYLGFHLTFKKLDKREEKRRTIEKVIILNEYWSRAWITQELCLAQSAVLVSDTEDDMLLRKLLEMVRRCVVQTADHPLCKLTSYVIGYGTATLASPVFKRLSDGSHKTRDDFISLLHRFLDKKCTIPRDRMFSLIPLYSGGGRLAVDYTSSDDELVSDISKQFEGSISVCSVTVMILSLLPRSSSLGQGYMEVNIKDLCLFWDSVQILSRESQVFKKPPGQLLRATRTICHPLKAICGKLIFNRDQELDSSYCRCWDLICESLLSRCLIVGSFEDDPWEAEAVLWQAVEAHKDFIPHTDGFYGIVPREWKLYTKGFTIQKQDREEQLWTFRISLQAVWDLVQTWDGVSICCHDRQSARLERTSRQVDTCVDRDTSKGSDANLQRDGRSCKRRRQDYE